MARGFDFNSFEQPTLEITLRGGKKLHLEVPTVSAVERVRDAVPALRERITEKNIGSLRRFYELLAELMSCNTEGDAFTADALENQYRIPLSAMLPFFTNYIAFLDEVRSAKN